MLTSSPFSRRIRSERVARTRESVIRKMTREAHEHDAINLSREIPDEDETPVSVKEAVKTTIDTSSQYIITWGLPELHEAVSERCADWKGVRYNPETGVAVITDTSGAIVSALLALCDPGGDVIYFEPVCESYVPAVQFIRGGPIPLNITDGLELDADALWDAA